MKRTLSCVGPLLLAAVGCSVVGAQSNSFAKPWGSFDGHSVYLYTLRNHSGAQVTITNYGGTITSISVKDRAGKFGDVVLGFDSLAGYTSKTNTSYFGATIGRYGNRLGKGTFPLDGKTVHVSTNEKANTLHGGKRGFDKHVWEAKAEPTAANPSLELHYVSADGEEGFPGKLDVSVRYTFTDANELKIEYSATTDKDTVLNLTNHSYFNLGTAGSGPITDEMIRIPAKTYTPVDSGLIPTGKLEAVTGTPFDLRKLTVISKKMDMNNEQIKFGAGYDENFVLDGALGTLKPAVEVVDTKSGRRMEVFTTEPGLQFYTGNHLDGTNVGVGGKFMLNGALCLETQHFPDSPNHPNFPTTELKPGQKLSSTTIYKFGTYTGKPLLSKASQSQ